MGRLSPRAALGITSQSSAPPSLRGVIDTLVQGSLVDLFAAYGCAAAPQPRIATGRSLTIPELSAAIGFARQGAAGQPPGKVTLSLPSAVVDLMRPESGDSLKSDWARELANQLMGRLKNRLLQFDVRLLVAVSTTIDSAMLAEQLPLSPSVRIYAARTLRGDAIVTVDGLPEDAQLSYRSPSGWPSEGDAILF